MGIIKSILDESRQLFDNLGNNLRNSGLLATTQCCICGKPVLGMAYRDQYGNIACASHKPLQCLCCGGFCKSDAVEIAQGRKLCSRCQKFSSSREDARKIIRMIRARYASVGLGKIERFHLELVSITDMAAMAHTGGDVLGLATQIRGEYHIRVCKHLSHTAIAGVLAHEILHIWQFQRHLYPQPEICEGFCDLGSYEIYSHIPTKHAQVRINMLQNEQLPVYGPGYRRVKAYYDKYGWKGVIEKILRTK